MSTERPEGFRPSARVDSHKLFPPPASRGAVPRRAILDRLAADTGVRAVLLQAPAGHGKSTLLQQIMSQCHQRGDSSGWLSFEDADNDLRRFNGHFDSLLDAICGDSSPARTSPTTSRPDAVIARLLRHPAPVALFFDEFQELGNPAILRFFRELLERLPERLTVFIGARALPDAGAGLGLSRLLVNGRALVLHADELRFSNAEAAQFFAEAGELGIGASEIAAIHRQTEGWPAALQLFRLSLASPSVRGALGDLGGYRPRELADYLADNVLALQTPRIREFLLRTSLLTRLSAPLCDALLGSSDAQGILQFLERSGLFLHSLDPERRWFRYHGLFSAFLLEQLRESDPQALRELHLRAARWYATQGLHDAAMHHAVEAGEPGLAVEVMERWSGDLVAQGHLATVERWYDRLPLDLVVQRRALAVKIAYALSFRRRHRKLRPLMQLLDAPGEQLGAGNPDVVETMVALLFDDIPRAFALAGEIDVGDDRGDPFRAFELSAACNVLAYRATAAGDYESARQQVMRSRAYSERAHARFSGGYSVAVTGINLLVQGELAAALERFRAGLADAQDDADASVAAAALVCCYIMALYDAEQLDAADALFTRFHDMIRDGVLLDFLGVAYQFMSRIHERRGNAALAVELLDEAENIGHLANWPRLVRMVDRERVRRHLLRGERERAQLIASRIPPQPEFMLPEGWLLFSDDSEGEAIGQIRLLIHCGRADEALPRLADELAQAGRHGRIRRLIKLHILEALAQAQRGRARPAYTAMRQALQLAAPHGFVGMFLDEGVEVTRLLREIYPSLREPGAEREAGNGSLPDFARRLLDDGAEAADALVAEKLTEGEKTLLAFLAQGVSNKIIAAELFVSENTVKFHLKNIYAKLGVGSRVQAINAARRMGLL